MYKLFEEYVKLNSNESNASSSQVSLLTQKPYFTNDELVMDTFDEYVDYLSQNVNDTGMSELDQSFLIITTVASEFAFSLSSRELTKYRSTILLENVESLILTQNLVAWF
ncbi:hypothetical protein V8G54_001692 [Vigna mungo]|uniref:HAT C-terminal dimerisation domain-containing protein n=1 Tax=Vigna mungo TaxID=3915 RepID=A0AAQ3SB65_VIGMU